MKNEAKSFGGHLHNEALPLCVGVYRERANPSEGLISVLKESADHCDQFSEAQDSRDILKLNS